MTRNVESITKHIVVCYQVVGRFVDPLSIVNNVQYACEIVERNIVAVAIIDVRLEISTVPSHGGSKAREYPGKNECCNNKGHGNLRMKTTTTSEVS